MATGLSLELQFIGSNIFTTFKTLSQSSWIGDEASNAPSRRRIETEHQRLRLWGQNLGLNQTGHASLDYRVRDASIIKASLVDLLNELQEHLQNFASIVLGHRPPAEQTQVPVDSDGESSEAECSSYKSDTFHEVDFRMDSVVERLDSLYKLAAKIRNPQYRPQRPTQDLYKYIPESEREDFRKNQENMEIFRAAFIQKEYLRQSLPIQFSSEDLVEQHGSSTHWLIRRIGIANARRLQQLQYWKTHSKILTRDISLEAPQTKQDARQDARQDASGGVSTITYTIEPREFSQTTATKLDERTLHIPSDEKSVISQHSGVSTVVNAQGQKLIWPAAPSHLPGSKEFLCPYCKVICPESYRLKKDKWRTHLIHDLQAYQCTYEDCTDAHRLYGEQQEWIDHENQHRRVWYCQKHAVEFETLPLFQHHIENEHCGEDMELSNQAASLLASPSSKPHRNCPFCAAEFDDGVECMRRHMRDHLLRLALLVLRGADRDDVESTNSDQSKDSSGKGVEGGGRRDSILKDFEGENLPSWEFSTDSSQLQSLSTREDWGLCSASASIGQEQHPVIREIQRKLARADEESASFLPESDLREIFTIKTVADILNTLRKSAECKHDPINTEKDICREGNERKRIKIFATLMCIDKPCYIASFILENVWDDQLPLSIDHHKELFKDWEKRAAWSFCESQYIVLAPVINFTTTEHRKFGPKHRMPFLDVQDLGWHKISFKIRIHEAHQIWKPPLQPQKYYAIKRSEFMHDSMFHYERAALEKFSRPNQIHDHLIELLFSYELGTQQAMIFPWADSNLLEFWKKNQSRPLAKNDLIWIITQCHGIADGLCKVHQYQGADADIGENATNEELLGHHGDINPNNILFFASKSQHGRLVVANFSSMRFHPCNVKDIDASRVGLPYGLGHTYRPPEMDECAPVTQKWDIWSLGCVFLEFISWHIVEEHDSFVEARHKDDKVLGLPGVIEDKFFNPDNNLHHAPRAKVKNSVSQWIDFLKQHPNASPASRDFLKFIIERMIVISPDNRCSMKAVRRELGRILDKSQDANDIEFFLPAPLRPSPPPVTEGKLYSRPFSMNSSHGNQPAELFSAPKSSSGALPDSSSDLNLIAKAFSQLVKDDFQPQARDNDLSVLPEASSVQEVKPVKRAGSGGSEHDGRQRSQRFESSTGEMQETANEELDISAGMTGSGQKRGTSRLARLGRLIPSNIRKRFRS